ncbi:MAG: formimidoylglutamase [Bacteroidota bacterium]
MESEEFLAPLSHDQFNEGRAYPENTLGALVKAHTTQTGFPVLKKVHLALVGVEEDRRSGTNKGCAQAPDRVREHLYRLYKGNYQVRLADLGNIKAGATVEDTDFALRKVIHALLKKQVVPIVIGGSNELCFANYLAYEQIESTINVVSVDSRIDLAGPDSDFDAQSWLGRIILHQPNHLFNYSALGYQTYLVNPAHLEMMNKLFFDTHRLGQVRAGIEEAEPVIRNADMIAFDMSAVRQTDAPGCASASPNGFYGEEACQLMRYAGMSDKLSSIGIYEINPALDRSGQTAHLAAQMIWCFIDGFYNRKKDYPFRKTTDYTKYHVSIKDLESKIVFYKSKKSDRWWMEVPYPSDKRLKFERHLLVPCSYSTYQTALEEEMPDQWWQTYQKLSF